MDDQYLAFYKTIGERIKEIRIQKKMSQAELAEKAHLSLPVISSLENARTKIWLVTFAKVAEALEVSTDDILRLNTPSSSASFPSELAEILDGCTTSERESILKIVKQLKATFEQHKKDFTY
ncbi:helix-turn-helix domain-containing protein [Oribacterium sp. C9]|uniref:helix-turn-helix domain-containing protein n=1 Tax=Oribacterium sp. C9 TaxID=1943579 RepID=UPI003FA60247